MAYFKDLPSSDLNATEYEFASLNLTLDEYHVVEHEVLNMQVVLENVRKDPTKSYSREQFLVEVVVGGCFCLLGLVCNVLALIGLWRDPQKNSTVYILSALAVTDWLILVDLCLIKVTPFLCVYTEVESCYGPLLKASVFIWPVGCMAQTAMIWLVVLVTVDRFIAICHPFKAVVLSTVSNAKKAILVIWVLAVLVNVPRFFYFFETDHPAKLDIDQTIIAVTDRNMGLQHNHTISSEQPPQIVRELEAVEQDLNVGDDFDALGPVKVGKLARYIPSPRKALGNTVWYRVIYYISFTWVFVYLIPMLTLIILNIRLARAIQQAKRAHAKMVGKTPGNRENNHSVTVNIIAVVVVFLVCQTPDFALVIISYPDLHVDDNIISVMSSVNTMFMAVNSSVNFFIYCLFYKKFRRVVQMLLCPAGVGDVRSE